MKIIEFLEFITGCENNKSKSLILIKIPLVLLVFTIVFIIIALISVSNEEKENTKNSKSAGIDEIKEVQVTIEPIKDKSQMTPFEILDKIGKDVAKDNSSVSTFKNKNGSIDVINNIQVTPEIIWESAMKVSAKKWATEFIRDSYNSGLDIRYVLVTVSFLHTGIPATRVGLGIKQAEKISSEDWKTIGETGLCYALKNSHIGDNVDVDSPSFNPSNWAFTKNCN